MKNLFLVCLGIMMLGIMITGNLFAQNFSQSGIDYQVVSNTDDFVRIYSQNKPVALRMRYADYNRNGLLLITESCNKFGVSQEALYDPSAPICQSCKYQLSMMEAMLAMMANQTINVCPNCEKSQYFVFLAKVTVTQSSDDNIKPALKEYCHFLAVNWWPNEGKKSAGICDSCYADVGYGNGYVYGFMNAGKAHAYRLWCEKCMNENLDKDYYWEESYKAAALDYIRNK